MLLVRWNTFLVVWLLLDIFLDLKVSENVLSFYKVLVFFAGHRLLFRLGKKIFLRRSIFVILNFKAHIGRF